MADPRLVSFLEEAGGDALVSAEPGLVRMLTGHVTDVDGGPSPFALPAVVVAPAAGDAQLVCSEDEAPAPDDRLHSYEGFTVGPIDRIEGARRALERAVARVGSPERLLVDGATVPATLAALLPGHRLADSGLGMLGAVKTAEEVSAVESALRLCEAGQAAARIATAEGAEELEVFAAVREAVEQAAGGRTTLIADLVAGRRTGDVGGPPSRAQLAAGDLLLCDLVPRAHGMWGDSCATWAVSDPSDGARAMHAAASDALRVGLDALRPGASGGEVDAIVRSSMANAGWEYPHHTGHGLGFRWHEEPRIVPGGRTMLEPGMVVALEPGAYVDGLGVRVEQVAVITETGHRLLSRHSIDLATAARGAAVTRNTQPKEERSR